MGGRGKSANTSAEAGSRQAPEPRDYLHLHSRKAVAFLAIVAVVLLVASMRSAHVKSGLPDVAFGWEFGLDVIRAAIVFAVVASILMVLVRGWGGIWPQRISSSGFEYEELHRAAFDLERERNRMRELKEKATILEEAEGG